MKKVFSTLFVAAIATISVNSVIAQKSEQVLQAELDKYKQPSPPEMAYQILNDSTKISIDYCAPSVRGRNIGKDLEPKEGEVWRAGANAATIFSTDKNITVEGKSLPAGKYTFFTLKNGDDWTLIFNKVLVQPNGKPTWGAYAYQKDKAQNALEVTVKEQASPVFIEKLLYNINKDGRVSLLWGNELISFHVN